MVDANRILTNSKLDEEDIKITDLVSIEFLKEFQDAFSNAVGVAAIISDENGQAITEGSNFTDFCAKLNRGCPAGLKRCMKSDAFGGEESARTGKPAVYYCENGLMDFGAPIMLNGKRLGSFLGGQILTSPPEDLEKYRKLALEIGVDPDEYIAALNKVKIVPEAQVRAAAELLYIVTAEISRMGYQRYALSKMAVNLHEKVVRMMATIEELTASASEVTGTQNSLNEEIQNVDSISRQINDVTESIKEIANETRLLGLNAAIEAAKAGEYGLGFGVVAEEIRKLSSDSKNTVSQIQEFTSQIKESMTRTSEMSHSTLTTTEQQELAIRDIVESIEDIVRMAEELNGIASQE